MDRVLTLEFVRVTEAAAVKAGRLMGKGDKMGADQLAVDGMHSILSTVPIDGTVVIGEGEMDEAPMLYIGEKVGGGGTDRPQGELAPRARHVHGKTLCRPAGERAHRFDQARTGKPAPHRRRTGTGHR